LVDQIFSAEECYFTEAKKKKERLVSLNTADCPRTSFSSIVLSNHSVTIAHAVTRWLENIYLENIPDINTDFML
jgi:hypothetical protein